MPGGVVVRLIVVSSLLVAAGGCGDDSTGSTDAPPPPLRPGASQPAADVAVGELLPSQTARGQAHSIRTLRTAGWTVETNGVEEAVVAVLEDGEIGPENGRRLAGLETLEQIRLWNCPDADDALVGLLSGLKGLRVLAVRGGALTDDCFELLADAAALESLNLGNTPGLTGRGVKPLLTSGRIKRLYLDRTGVNDEVIGGWPVENSLEMLNLNHTRLGPNAAETLRGFAGLRSAFVVQAGISTDAVAKWRAARPGCLVYDGRERPGGSQGDPAADSP